MTEFYKEIFNYVQRLSGNRDLAQDLTQETYAKAFKLDIHKRIENKRAYLFKIARHLVYDESRKKKKATEILYKEENYSISQEEFTEDVLEQKERKQHLLECIKTLPKKNKEAFYLFAIEGYSRKEIAIKMQISASAVEKNIQRASKKIQEKLEKEEF